MLPICVRPERVWPKLSSIQGIRANLVYIVSLDKPDFLSISNFAGYRALEAVKIKIKIDKKSSLSNLIFGTQFFKNQRQINRGKRDLQIKLVEYKAIQLVD